MQRTQTQAAQLIRRVVQEDDFFISRFDKEQTPVEQLAVSSQHYTVGADAFAKLINEVELEKFAFQFRETRTEEVIDDVRCQRYGKQAVAAAQKTRRQIKACAEHSPRRP